MADLQRILSPQDGPRRTVKLLVNLERGAFAGGIPTSPASASELSETANADEPPPTEHEPHPDCPDTLACLPDTDGRPQHTLPVILRCAILGSPKKRLTIREIYAAMEAKYLYYKTAGPTWKQSVRHHLSLNRLFERQPRPVTDPGFGSYWTVNLAAPPGTKRPRKRGRPNADASEGSAQPPKKRGRPRKTPLPPVEAGPSEPSTLRASYDADKPVFEEDMDGGEGSEDECESEEEMIHPFDRRSSLSGLSAFHQPSRSTEHFSLPPFSSLSQASDNMVERMQIEMISLRRQSADAVSVSLRLSDQLAQAQAEASRTRAALRAVEGMLEDESKKRREAEMIADDETKRRRVAEDALDSILRRRPTHSP